MIFSLNKIPAKRNLIVFAAIVFALAAGGASYAHVGGHGNDRKNIRTWSVAATYEFFKASFLFKDQDRVHFELDHGKVKVVSFGALAPQDRAYIEARLLQVRETNNINAFPGASLAADAFYLENHKAFQAAANDTFSIFTAFAPFKDAVKTRFDNNYFYVESNGMPNHNMMVGITSWQQQVPLPQPYNGTNAWRIPLRPVLAAVPISTKKALYTGAIALAINGVPIFNALNNRGDDAYLFGELDQWGGHCGRADDYHYHIAPWHIETIVGKTKPIAVALDGYPIYGSLEPDSTAVMPLDSLNGHFDKTNRYHYHGTKTYPYINGGMRGVVQVQNDQITPQPRTTPVRPFLQPLNGATVTGFAITGSTSYSLQYTRNNQIYYVNYRYDLSPAPATYTFVFVDPSGGTVTKVYRNGQLVTVGGEAEDMTALKEFVLYKNYPNPFNPATTIKYYLPERAHATLTIYNQLGQKVAVLVDKMETVGSHAVTWEAGNLAAGTYFYELRTEKFTQTKTMQLMK